VAYLPVTFLKVIASSELQNLVDTSFGEGSDSWVWNYHVILHLCVISQI